MRVGLGMRMERRRTENVGAIVEHNYFYARSPGKAELTLLCLLEMQ